MLDRLWKNYLDPRKSRFKEKKIDVMLMIDNYLWYRHN